MAARARKKTVAVIGAGMSGLASMKTFQENDYAVHGFDINSDIGGLWNYDVNKSDPNIPFEPSSDPSQPLATTYSSLKMNTSVWTSVYSDFPPKEGTYDEFMTHAQYTSYLKSYANRYKLYKKIDFNTIVTRLEKSQSPPGWVVHFTKKNQTYNKHFTFVIVSTGAFRYQKIPKIPGLSDFGGHLMQSNQIRDTNVVFKDKTVLVIGGSVTGADLACKAVKSGAKKVYLSPTSRPTERNRWYMDRYPDGSPNSNPMTVPWDMQISRSMYIQSQSTFFNAFLEGFMMPFVSKNPKSPANTMIKGDAWMIADTKTLKKESESGRLKKIDVVCEVTPKEVILNDGSKIYDLELLIIATGFEKRFPFIDHIWPKNDQARFELYNYVVPLVEGLDGIAFIGMVSAPTGVFIVAEMQARWLASVWKKSSYDENSHLFTTERRIVMREHVKYIKSTSAVYNFISDPFIYMDSLASYIDSLPLCSATEFSDAIEKSISVKDIELAVAVWHGPYISSHYQLNSENAKVRHVAETTVKNVCRRYMGSKYDELVKYYSEGRFQESITHV